MLQDSSTNQQAEADSESADKYRLLELLDDIKPGNLARTSQTNYVRKLGDQLEKLILCDGANLVLVVEAVKGCKKPCYKRDVLLELLRNLVTSVGTLSRLLAQPFGAIGQVKPWKELANCLVSVPDVAANCQALDRCPELKSDTYYSQLLTVLYGVLLEGATKEDLKDARLEQKRLLFSQLLGRIALTHCQLVWTKFTSRAMLEGAGARVVRLLVAEIIASSSSSSSSSLANTHCLRTPATAHLGTFVEPLIAAILYNFTPRSQAQTTGTLIKSILGSSIFHNELLEYVLCNKYLLQTNYRHTKRHQLAILFNVFSYLASLNQEQEQEEGEDREEEQEEHSCPVEPGPASPHPRKQQPYENLLIKTLLAVADCWADATKVLLRPYEQSRYITCALMVGLRYALDNDKPSLAKCAHQLQASIIQGFPVYLNRASARHRKLAMCLGEVVLVRLHQVADGERPTEDLIAARREPVELKFDVEWDSDVVFMKNLLDCDIVGLFEERAREELGSGTSGSDGDAHHCGPRQSQGSSWRSIEEQLAASHSPTSYSKEDDERLIDCVAAQLKQSTLAANDEDEDAARAAPRLRQIKHEHLTTKNHSSGGRAVIELDSDDDGEDLVPYQMSNEDAQEEEEVDSVEQDEQAPIYLRDCMAGLAENKHPRYVRLCLIRAGVLVEQKNNELATLASAAQPPSKGAAGSGSGSAIDDVAVELARLLLYLDDQYEIDQFEAHRMRALSGLCAASPHLAAKYLLDEFNGTGRSVRHQLDILQALVMSAERLVRRATPTTTFTTRSPLSPTTTTTTKTTTTTTPAAAATNSATTNGFVKYVSLYFYGMVHRLKADLSVTISPSTIVSAAAGSRANANSRRRETAMIRRVIDSLTSSKSQIDGNLLFSSSQRGGFAAPAPASATASATSTTGSSIDAAHDGHARQQAGSTNIAPTLSGATTSLKRAKTTETKTGQLPLPPPAPAPPVEQGKELEDHDNSYLLSRLLFSVSQLMRSVHQQPVACALANDLLDILAAYRWHPDVGVRGAIWACLAAIREHAPSVYFREYLYDKTISLFGEWLSSELGGGGGGGCGAQLTKLLGD